MFATVTLEITGSASESLDNGNFPQDTVIIDAMRSCGIELSPRHNGLEGPETSYSLVCIEPKGSVVPARSIYHYRDLSHRNLVSDAPLPIKKEMELYGVFFGVVSSERTQIHVSRPQAGSITIHLYNRDAAKCAKSLGILLEKLYKRKIFSENSKSSREVEVFTASSGVKALSGKYKKHSIADTFNRSTIEIFVLIFCLFLGSAAFLLDTFIPATSLAAGYSDPLPMALRKLVEATWPAMAISVATLLVTVLAIHFSASRYQLVWDQNNQ